MFKVAFFTILIKKYVNFTVFDSSLGNDNFDKLLCPINIKHKGSKNGKSRKVDLT